MRSKPCRRRAAAHGAVRRRNARCQYCGTMGATIQLPGWFGANNTEAPFPADRMSRWPKLISEASRRPADLAVVRLAERHRHEHVHAAQQVVLGDAVFQPKLVEQPALIPPCRPSSPRPPLPIINQPAESRFAGLLKPFFDSIDPNRTSSAIHQTGLPHCSDMSCLLIAESAVKAWPFRLQRLIA